MLYKLSTESRKAVEGHIAHACIHRLHFTLSDMHGHMGMWLAKVGQTDASSGARVYICEPGSAEHLGAIVSATLDHIFQRFPCKFRTYGTCGKISYV